jgi:hypothetical protein
MPPTPSSPSEEPDYVITTEAIHAIDKHLQQVRDVLMRRLSLHAFNAGQFTQGGQVRITIDDINALTPDPQEQSVQDDYPSEDEQQQAEEVANLKTELDGYKKLAQDQARRLDRDAGIIASMSYPKPEPVSEAKDVERPAQAPAVDLASCQLADDSEIMRRCKEAVQEIVDEYAKKEPGIAYMAGVQVVRDDTALLRAERDQLRERVIELQASVETKSSMYATAYRTIEDRDVMIRSLELDKQALTAELATAKADAIKLINSNSLSIADYNAICDRYYPLKAQAQGEEWRELTDGDKGKRLMIKYSDHGGSVDDEEPCLMIYHGRMERGDYILEDVEEKDVTFWNHCRVRSEKGAVK